MMIEADSKKKKSEEELVNSILDEYGTLSSDRGEWESHWREISERMLPAHKDLFQSRGFQENRGEKKNEYIFDSTAAVALNRFAAILDSLLTPRNQTWHRIMPSDPRLAKDRQTRLWFEDVNRLLFKFRYSPTANFSSQNQMVYKMLGAYGTGPMFIDELFGEIGLRYRACHLSEIYFAENHQGIVDRAHRYFAMTARQAAEKWGLDNLPGSIKSAANGSPDQEFFFIHCVKDRTDYDPNRVDAKGMRYGSYYVSVDGRKLLQEGGYTTFPYAIPRYEQSPGEVYGRSPAMDVLPAVKTLNEQKKTVLKQGHRAVDPVLLAHDDGIIDTFSLKPGHINAGGISADGRPLVQPLPVGNISIGKDLMDDERAVINDAFLITLFQILIETPQMTATEIMERTREKGILLAPTIGRQQSEYLGPMIEREVDILSRQGVLPPMPPALREAGGEFRIEYDSPISRTQRAEEAAGIMRTVESALNIVNITQNPEPLDFFNWDAIIPAMADIQGVPAAWMKSQEDVMALRQGRAQQAQNQEMIQAAPAAAAMVKAGAAAKQANKA